MNLKEQHQAAKRLLQRLGVSTIRLERVDGHYRYVAWETPSYLLNRDGKPRIAKTGTIKAG